MPGAARLGTDFERLQALAARTSGLVVLHSKALSVLAPVDLELRYAIAASERYPADVGRQTRLSISLAARYPFQPPLASVRTPIWHPNVFLSGTICLGTRWLPTEGLDLFVQRIARLLTFDPLLVNTASPANRDAAAWYERTRRRHPEAFPTDRPTFSEAVRPDTRGHVGWRDATAAAERVLRSCPACGRALRLPPGRAGRVRCPGCDTRFEART